MRPKTVVDVAVQAPVQFGSVPSPRDVVFSAPANVPPRRAAARLAL
ncbi:hypothetical protein [Streptomyces sp. NPDC057740]